MSSTFDIRQLRYFVKIAELGSFTKAAPALNIAQSALSYQMQRLEAALNVPLFNRDRRGVTLTEAGRVAFQQAQAILDSINQFKSQVSSLAAHPSGPVSLSILPSFSRILVPPLIERVQRLCPDIRLLIEEATAGTNYARLKEGRTDLAFLHDVSSDREVETTTLVREHLHLVGSGPLPSFRTNGLVAIEELADVPLVLTTMASSWRRRIEKSFRAKGIHPSIRAEVDSLSAILELVRRGGNCSIVPKSVVQLGLTLGQMWAIKIGPPTISFGVELAKLKYRELSGPAVVLRKFIIQTVQELTDPRTGQINASSLET